MYGLFGHGPLIRSVLVCPPLQRVKANPPCYDTVLSWFKEAATLNGLDPKFYGTHSGRRGGESGAAARDVPDRLFKRHGRWRTDRAKELYVKEHLQNKLGVSRNLGLQADIPSSDLRAFEKEACLVLSLFVSGTCALNPS
jgi:hypothetical protein